MKNHSNIYVQISEFPKKRVTSGRIVFTNRENLAWGPKKIREIYAKAYPQKDVPSLSSVKRILDKAGLVKPRKIRPPIVLDYSSKYRLRRQMTFGVLTSRDGGNPTGKSVNRSPFVTDTVEKSFAQS